MMLITPIRNTLNLPRRSPSAPPTVTKPATTIKVRFNIHWLAVTEIPKSDCMLGRPTWVAAISIAQVESPAAAVRIAKRFNVCSFMSLPMM